MEFMGSSVEDVKATRWTRWRLNAMPNMILGVWTLRFFGHNQLVRSGNYCYSSIWADSLDENKNSHWKITMTQTSYIWSGFFHRMSSSAWCSVHIFGIWSTSRALVHITQFSQDHNRPFSWEYKAGLMSGRKCWSRFVFRVF